jgi:hypothetical protein
MNKSVEQPAPAAHNMRLIWAITAAVMGLIVLVELLDWSRGKGNIRLIVMLAGLSLVNIGKASERVALRRMLPIVGLVLAGIGALLTILHWAH